MLQLYKRFTSLDRSDKGYLSEDEIMKIPELSINPLSSRIVRIFENVNFKEFCKNLAPFSPKASRDEKVMGSFVLLYKYYEKLNLFRYIYCTYVQYVYAYTLYMYVFKRRPTSW